MDDFSKAFNQCDTTQSCTVSFKLTAQPEEAVSKPSCETAVKEDEPQVQKQVALERSTPEGADLSTIAPTTSSLKEKKSSQTTSNEQGDQNRKDVVEGATECDLPEESKAEDAKQASNSGELSNFKTEDERRVILTSNSGTLMDESKEKPTEVTGSDVTLLATSMSYIQKVDQMQEITRPSPKHDTEHDSYSELSSKSPKEELSKSQSYYELSTAGETRLCEQTESTMPKLDDHHARTAKAYPDKIYLEQRSLSLNPTVGSPAGQTDTGLNSKAISGPLCPVSGSLDGAEVYPSTPSVISQENFPPVVSITTTTAEISETILIKAETPLPSDEQNSRYEHSGSLSEMLDLAGALLRPSMESRELDHIRRKSMPGCVSFLVGSSLASLALGEQTSKTGGENQLEELGYCNLSEYAGPMPSPADVPSPGESPQQRFPSIENEVEEDLGGMEVESDQKVQKQRDEKIIPEISQKTVSEKKDVPVKTTLILEKAVTSGVKPDRLRIPINSSKDRLSEFRLESGLPGDLKIQAIPEVDIEKDPSREASPIPPDNSFTFTVRETGSKASPTHTTPKSLIDTPQEITAENSMKKSLPEVKAENDPKVERTGNKKIEPDREKQKSEQEEPEGLHKTHSVPSCQSEETTKKETATKLDGLLKETSKSADDPKTNKSLVEKKVETKSQDVTPYKYPPKPHMATTVIVIPQAQVEEEADEEDDIEIAEEPQEVMEDTEIPPKTHQAEESPINKTEKEEQKEQVKLMVGRQVMEEDPKSGAEEWSHSGQNSDDGEPATDSSRLSPCSDHDQLVELTRKEGMGEETAVQVTEINRDKWKKEQAEGVKEEQAGNQEARESKEREQKMDIKEEEMEKDVEIGQEVEETSEVLCQTSEATNNESTVDISIIDTDSGWMETQGTKNL